MKIIAIADTHLGFLSGRNKIAKQKMSDVFYHSFENIMKTAIKDKIDLVIHGGDFFNRSKPDKSEIKGSSEIIENLLHKGIGFVASPGNHDKARLPDSLWQYYFDNYRYFNKLERFNFDDLSIIGFPFEYNSPRQVFENALKLVEKKPKTSHFILCHQLFRNASFGPHEFTFKYQNDVIQADKLPNNISLVISGHIHRAQQLFNGKVVYTGSTERTSFNEIIEPKGYLEIVIEDDRINPFISVKFREIESYSMEVLEISIQNRVINRDLCDEIENKIKNPNARLLLRLLNRNLSREEIVFLYEYFNQEIYPYFSFSPRTPEHKLSELYGNYNKKFEFNDILIKNNSLSQKNINYIRT